MQSPSRFECLEKHLTLRSSRVDQNDTRVANDNERLCIDQIYFEQSTRRELSGEFDG